MDSEVGTILSSRFESVDLSTEQKSACRIIGQQCSILEAVINATPMDARYRAIALTKLEEVAMMATKGVSRDGVKVEQEEG